MLIDFQNLLESVSIGIVVVDDSFQLEYLNPAAQELFQCSANRALHRPMAEIVVQNEELDNACHKAMKEWKQVIIRDCELVLAFALVSKRADCVISPVQAGSRSGLLLEISESEPSLRLARGAMMNERQQSNLALVKALAHEIRNPLGGVRGAAQLLAVELKNEELREYTGVILREADRLTSLVDRMQAGGSVKLDGAITIHGVLEHVRQLVLAESGQRIGVVQDYDPSLPLVRGDEGQLVQAVINVARNAMDALSDGGEMRFRTRIDNQFLPAGNCMQQVVRVDVIDNGSGIDAEIIDQIFDPMITGRPEGTGLGLAITAEIIQRHGGLISVRSRPGKTVFSLYLPVHAGKYVEGEE
jgi:two-component system nitrogen regulation sensor histidine kinase GlnL